MEMMLEWHCRIAGGEGMVAVQWDGAQFGKETVSKWADGFMDALRWLACEGNRGEKVGGWKWGV